MVAVVLDLGIHIQNRGTFPGKPTCVMSRLGVGCTHVKSISRSNTWVRKQRSSSQDDLAISSELLQLVPCTFI